jgi:vacuolar-type H+-ATPase subunit H
MTTDQIKQTESAVGAINAVPESGVAADRSANEARQIVAKARYEAFRMVTDARNDADAILEEAQAEAAGVVDFTEANGTIAAENADLVAVNAALRAEYNEFVDLINASQDLLEKLDVRLLDLATMPDTLGQDDLDALAEIVVGEKFESKPYVFDYTPSVAPEPKPGKKKATTVRAESFYTRKSAKLPRIGREGGQDALAAVKSMRDALR